MSEQMKIILICGYAGSGKDAAGAVLQDKGYKRYAYADMLKIQTAHKYGFPFELTQMQEGKATIVAAENKSVRQLLIIEAALMKELYNDPAYWARLLADAIRSSSSSKVVITDWRYNAELTNFQEEFPHAQITTIRINRPSVIPSADPSEHELDNYQCNYTIQNEGTLEQLVDTIKVVVEQLPIPELAPQ